MQKKNIKITKIWVSFVGQKWKRKRKIITPAFHFAVLEKFVDVFNTNGATLVQRLKDEALGEESVDIYKYVTACALDIICGIKSTKT